LASRPPPPATTAIQAAPVEQQQAPPEKPASQQGANVNTGDMTHYTPGMGSCGHNDAGTSEFVVAMSGSFMQNGVNPNNNPLCGKTITITYNGVTQTARIVDTCPPGECTYGSIDVNEACFQAVAPAGDGRVHGVSWYLNE
jgi:hypothetical protein